ncbi:hypothetical protein PENARI_c192G01349 [Penicillium arizonense]|uniref:MADS-box domain-containing protein n=1 Tax=Penicillium arizonense TaxID=1835702 RepID=A0A1F5L0J9_PENAI|nr:hypothetical protein PENARI_c192G01349 [Penicillium arizonense]OGE46557.1 hypothetical protein PENARI_c192G01349 [Penicillium arizonense]
MVPALSRVKREQLRKRRNNLLRRHNEFWLLYGMKSWLIMELPDGQIFTYHSHPDVLPPSKEDMNTRSKPTVVRTPRDYNSTAIAQSVGRDLPVPYAPIRENKKWDALAQHLKNYRRTVS